MFVRGLFNDQVELLCEGVACIMAGLGPHAAEILFEGEGGRFSDDYCNWTRIPDFQEAIDS